MLSRDHLQDCTDESSDSELYSTRQIILETTLPHDPLITSMSRLDGEVGFSLQENLQSLLPAERNKHQITTARRIRKRRYSKYSFFSEKEEVRVIKPIP